MSAARFRFGNFIVDPVDRRLLVDGLPVSISPRYLDALLLLVAESGRLVSKDRFMDEVWHGIPVTDEALTQCIRTLRRALGDSASDPRFIETVPKHGYRFIAPVVRGDAAGYADPQAAVAAAAQTRTPPPAAPADYGTLPGGWRLRLGAAGTLGAALAGLIGGILYGFAGMSVPSPAAATSVLAVLVCVTVLVALAGGAAVSFGIAACARDPVRPWRWSIAGGAAGGLLVGAVAKLLGGDAFVLLLGQSPGDITGAAEGLALGAAAGFGLWFGGRGAVAPPRRSIVAGALAGGGVGWLIPMFGGRLMVGSLELLARTFPDSRLRLDGIGALFGEPGLGVAGQAMTGALEGALFAACVVGTMAAAARRSAPRAVRPDAAAGR